METGKKGNEVNLKTIVAGSRYMTNQEFVFELLDNAPFPITAVVSGAQRGVDTLGEAWAEKNNIPVIRVPAQWHIYGRGAGPVRNKEMATQYNVEAVIAIWKGDRGGTWNMINIALEEKLHLWVINYDRILGET